MIIKKFVGKNEEDALAAAKKEMGENIVKMNSKEIKKKGLFSIFRSKQVDVTVALEEENDKYAAGETVSKTSGAKENVSAKNSFQGRDAGTESIEKRLDSLQLLLENQMRKAEEQRVASALDRQDIYNDKNEADSQREKEKTAEEKEVSEEVSEQEKFLRLLYNTMLSNEVDEKFANQILEDIDKGKKCNMPIDYILTNIYQKMILKFGKSDGITTAENGPKVVVFIGPTGVGKTTTIAKIASHYSMNEKKKIALLTSDTYRIAAAEQLKTYANILEVPFRVIYTEDELVRSVSDFKECDYIFVDTTGHSHQNEEQLKKMQELVASLNGKADYQVFLVLSATTKYQDLLKIAAKYREISEYQLIFTKLDETESLGNLLNVKLNTGSSIAYTAYGQNVPDDIDVFDPQMTVKQLLGGKN